MAKKSITQLYAEFEKARVALDASPYPYDETGEEQHTAAIDLCSALCARIVKTRANPKNPVPEMLLKIAVAGWGHNGELDRWPADPDGEIEDCVVSLRADLQAMAQVRVCTK